MMHTKRKAWIVVVITVLLIKLFSLFPSAVERYYSTGVYPLLSRLLRLLFGWIPFSIGDLLYGFVAIVLLMKLWRFMKALRAKKPLWKPRLQWLFFYMLLVYAVFNLFWGLNYNRLGTAQQLQLELKPYSTGELDTVLQVMLQRLESTADASLATRDRYLRKRNLFDTAVRSYGLVEQNYPQLVYRNRSVKPSLFSYLGDYMGYTGYYNPFTGEAQVNTTVPVFVQPFTTCHEMGHQLGYAKENEANFAGFLSARASADPAFRYSVYFDMYSYGIRELYGRDSARALELNRRKPVQVKKDVLTLQKFYDAYENPIEPYIRKLYGQYLRANEQPSGMKTYSEVMAFLVAYGKKYGVNSL